ncbi:MAG: double-strand break repair helicase AddA [Alphaproteobacteria bacterium]|nr:double-strand break repair helicase AddA [Alphaproteobacteria bacterium]MBU1527377.1 double-strand break repair helicase AddA [Alphaproteobacteria bacterium]MBU2350830.1 double-strand break repair helicase AddA [Alphaproteobacteria bacterium]
MSRPLPDPAQRAAADPGASVFVVANAGSGKTSTLVDRVARLLLTGTKPAEILCVTYTKAAAAEMQGRLYERLGKWAIADDATLRAEMAALDGSDGGRLTPDALSRARRLFARALETPGGLKIQTLHAFCEQLLRRFPLEAGVDPGFEVLDDAGAAELSTRARDDLARHALADPDGAVGRAYAHFAVMLDWQSFQDLLGRIEADRDVLTAWLERIADGVSPGPHRAFGAPDETLEEHQSGFMRRLDRGRWLALAEAIATGSKTDADCAARMRTADWSFEAVRSVFLTKDGPRAKMATKQAPPAAAEELTQLQAAYLHALDVSRKIRTAEETLHVLALARVHAAFYEAAKARTQALDFADLIAAAVQLLTVRADAAWVLFKLDGGVDHVLLDEAQDTAPEQWEILKALTEAFFAGAGAERATDRPRTVFAVGDEKQSIYSFQGARPERLRAESQRYDLLARQAGLPFAGVELATSFRSTPQVLAFVDRVFETPERTAALVGPDVATPPHHLASRQGQAGSVDLWEMHVDPPKVERDAWEPVDAEPEEGSRKALARDLAKEIKRQVAGGVAVHEKTGALRPAGWGDYLVLVRKRDGLFEEILRALKAEGVPVAGADRLMLSEHVAFHDLRALARFALFPHDDLTVAEILRGPFCEVSEESLFDLAGREGRGGLWGELRRRGGERADWGHALALLDAARDMADRDAFGFFAGLLNRVDARGLTGRVRMLNRLGAEAAEAIDETLNLALAVEGRGAVDLETALGRMETAEVQVKRELEGPRGQVRVMTVHGAKGLEAPVVILPDTTGAPAGGKGVALLPLTLPDGTEGRVLCASSKGEDCDVASAARTERDERGKAEGLRLLYVALTRARDRVIVMGRHAATKKGAPEGSWRDVIEETFGRLADVRDLTGATGKTIRRFGPDPVTAIGPAAVVEATPPVVPAWARRVPPADVLARPSSPSRLEGSIRVPAPSPLATAAGPGAPLGRFRRGDLIHRLLERLPDVEPARREAVARRLLAREPDLDEARIDEMVGAALGVLDDAVFAEVFGPGSRAEVAVAGKVGGLTVSGRIDRLAITPDRVLVIDFKTNRPAPDRIEDADPAYLTQMALYVAALRTVWPGRRVEAALVWTDGPRLMPVPEALLAGG